MIFWIILLAFACGVLAGRLSTKRANQNDLLRAHAKGVIEGQADSSWELHCLRNRVHALEANIRTVRPRLNGARK